MRLTIVFLLALSVLAFTSCRKKRTVQYIYPQPIDDVVVPHYQSPEYLMAKPGNYWVYREYRIIDHVGVEETNFYDTTRVEKDTLIGKRMYHKLVGSNMMGTHVTFITDSLDYIVTNYGRIIFSATDFNRTFRAKYLTDSLQNPPGVDTIAYVTQYMGDQDLVINVPIGTFKTSSFIESYKYHHVPPSSPPTQNYYYRYAKGVGLVSYTAAIYRAGITHEYRLVQYKVQ